MNKKIIGLKIYADVLKPFTLLTYNSISNTTTNDVKPPLINAKVQLFEIGLFPILRINRYVNLAIGSEIGYSRYNITLDKDRFRYQTYGIYYRPGFDVDLVVDENFKTKLQFLYRYSFTEAVISADIRGYSQYWDEYYTQSYKNIKETSIWNEFGGGVMFSLIKNYLVYLSLNGKLRVLVYHEKTPIPTWNIPGYGANDKAVIAINLQLGITL
ncbi:MAG: hypothetical protein SFY32_09630 [Bacteroidota bacterium]|nr:hypothetical protein [Bacteroidota bacterium]